jgi:large subunit ribosomal protein L31
MLPGWGRSFQTLLVFGLLRGPSRKYPQNNRLLGAYRGARENHSTFAGHFCLETFFPYFCSPLKEKTMKKGIHPEYKDVIFWDTSSDFKFMSRSTLSSKETVKWTDGKDYPVIKVEVSSASHPFFTGKKMFLDTAGRVEKFQKKYQKK